MRLAMVVSITLTNGFSKFLLIISSLLGHRYYKEDRDDFGRGEPTSSSLFMLQEQFSCLEGLPVIKKELS